MKTKTFYGIKFNVYTNTKIEGDFIKENEAVYFENDIEITGNLKVKYLKAEKSINVHKFYNVEQWEEVGGSQEVGGYLKAKSSRIGLYSKVKKEYQVEGKVFIGVCEWRETTEDEETLTCGKFISGNIKYGKLKEIGLEVEQDIELTPIAKIDEVIELNGKKYKRID